jgi:hypothetical protein
MIVIINTIDHYIDTADKAPVTPQHIITLATDLATCDTFDEADYFINPQ